MAPCELKPATVLRVGLQTPRCAPGPLLGKQGTESPTPSSCTSSFSRSASWHSRLQCAKKPGLKRPCFTVLTQALDLLELLLRFASQIPHEPLGGKSILRGHPIAHNCIKKGFSLTSIKTKNLGAEGAK